MIKTIRLIKVNFRKILTSPGFYACAVLTAILCFSAMIYYDSTALTNYSVIRAFMKFNREQMLSDMNFCTYQVIVSGSGSWLSMFIPIIAAFAFVPLLCDERESGAIRCCALRTTKRSLYAGSFLSALLSGGLAVLLGFLLFFVIVFFMFPDIRSYEPALQEFFASGLSENYPLFSQLGYPYLFALKFLEMFIYGALSAIPAFVLTGFIRNKYLIICIPFFLKYIVTQTYQSFWLTVASDFGASDHDERLEILEYANIDAVNSLFSYGNNTWKHAIIFGVLLLAAYILYILAMNRRVDSGT